MRAHKRLCSRTRILARMRAFAPSRTSAELKTRCSSFVLLRVLLRDMPSCRSICRLHYTEAAYVCERLPPGDENAFKHICRLKCKAAKCDVAIAIRMLRKGTVSAGLVHSVRAMEEASGSSREQQELASEAMEVWADSHTALSKLTPTEVARVQGLLDEMLEEERVLSSGFAGEGFEGGPRAAAPLTPLSHKLSADVEDNSNHAIR